MISILGRKSEKKFFMNPIYYKDSSLYISQKYIENYFYKCRYIDIPFDQYIDIESDIDAKNAEKYVNSIISYEIAKNIAQLGVIKELVFDPFHKNIISSHVGGIIFTVLFDFYIRNGFSIEESLEMSVHDQFKCIRKTALGEIKEAAISSIYRSDPERSYSEIFANTLFANQNIHLSLNFYRLSISQNFFRSDATKKLATLAVNAVSESSGKKIGSSLGSVVPIIGSRIGASMGESLGAYGGAKLTNFFKKNIENFENPIDKLYSIFRNTFEQLSFNFALSQKELQIFYEKLHTLICNYNDKNLKIIEEKDILKIGNVLKKEVIHIAKLRKKNILPTDEVYQCAVHRICEAYRVDI